MIVLYACVLTTEFFEIFAHQIYNLHWDTFLVMGYAKACITFVKYLPQVYLNWKRKSTVGWSLGNVILDFTGGLFSFLQMWIDAKALGNPVFTGDSFNVVKFILSVMSIIFDTIFLIQHYVLYRHAWKKDAVERKESENALMDSMRQEKVGVIPLATHDSQKQRDQVNVTDSSADQPSDSVF